MTEVHGHNELHNKVSCLSSVFMKCDGTQQDVLS